MAKTKKSAKPRKPVTAEIISIGDELLIGQVVNTNASWLAEKLVGIGIMVGRVTTVGDSPQAIQNAFRTAWNEHDVVIVTGGLGPTHDDISKAEVAKFFKRKLKLNGTVLKAVQDRFKRFGYAKMPESNIGQAMVPEGFKALKNDAGTAPGLLYQKQGKSFAILPGVPREMKWISENALLRTLKLSHGKKSPSVIRHRILMTVGIGESALAERIGDAVLILEESATLAFLPGSSILRLRITVQGNSLRSVEAKIGRIEKRIRAKAEEYIYGVDDAQLEDVIVELLRQDHLTIATAESCTGGMLSSKIVNVSGASDVFMGGIISYANEIKHEILGVSSEILEAFGAVSAETARAMAEGARAKLGTGIALSVTGVAGPLGGTDDKPVGTVWIALATATKTAEKLFHFAGNRLEIRERAVVAALNMVRKERSSTEV